MNLRDGKGNGQIVLSCKPIKLSPTIDITKKKHGKNISVEGLVEHLLKISVRSNKNNNIYTEHPTSMPLCYLNVLTQLIRTQHSRKIMQQWIVERTFTTEALIITLKKIH